MQRPMSAEAQGSNIDVEVKGFFPNQQEEEILNRQLDGTLVENAPSSVLAYASRADIAAMVISGIAAIIAGALNPLLTVIYGSLVGTFQDFSNHTITGSELLSNISKFTLYFVYLAIGEFVFIYIATVGFYYTGERIVRKLRRAYLTSIIRQNMAFFDVLGPGEVTARITSGINLIHEGITSKLALSITASATFVAAFVIAFVEYWKLALILTSVIAAMSATGTLGAKFAIQYTKRSLESYGSGAAVAEEAIGSIRHVVAFGIQEQLAQKYLKFVLIAEKYSIKAGAIVALMIGVMHGIPYLSYGLSFWQGSRYVTSGHMSAESVVTTTLAIVIGAFAIGKVTPNAQAFVSSMASAASIFETISRQSTQDPLSNTGSTIETVKGGIALKNVKLIYPSRKNVLVLKDLSLEFPAGETTAIVGASGCGKSSIFGLIERFYEPVGGHIELDGRDIRSLNLRWMRKQIAYINQEPMLFDTTIFENIRYGLPEEGFSKEELHSLVITAAKQANAHDFIMALPQGYETEIGERGLQLSGGQRQRLTIARAIVSAPKILLLDEATSALDAMSESIVQNALESASKGRTTIIIAHRLSTVKRADNIIVMSGGSVVEQGTHYDLMTRNGIYAGMVEKQIGSDEKQEEDNSENDSKSDTRSKDEAKSNVEVTEQAIARDPSNEYSRRSDLPGLSLYELMKLVSRLLSQEWWIISMGLFFSTLVGLGTPAQSIIFAHLVDTLSLPPTSYDHLLQQSRFWCLMYLVLGICGLTFRFAQGLCFSFVSEKLTSRARDSSMRSILRQDIDFFDQKEHSTGALTAFLSTGTTHLNSLSGAILGSIFSFLSTIIGGIVLSLVVGWKLALVCSATIPLVAGCGWVRLKILALFDDKIKKTQEESASYAGEALTSIRTIASLGLEDRVLDHYSSILSRQAAKSLRSILQASSLYAASQSVVFLCAALGFWYGGSLIASGEYSMLQFYICFAALISGSQSAGAIFSFAPDMSKAMRAGRDLKTLLDRQPSIDTWDPSGHPVDEHTTGSLEIKNVSFRYPSRPERLVLDNFSLSIQPGQYIALVGSSGCGKSTIISLLERFFDPIAGKILFDGKDISEINIKDYRSMISLVSQEATIYQGTVKENIVLGAGREISDEALTEACRAANILDFILSLPDGFATIIGARGNLLSGGQKQRITIARALLRNPRILLLDEATSALDSESEKLVQEALDSISKHRTTIAVAHRLSTIKKANLICVLDNGRLVESGTHKELMERQQFYYQLIQMQNLEIEKN